MYVFLGTLHPQLVEVVCGRHGLLPARARLPRGPQPIQDLHQQGGPAPVQGRRGPDQEAVHALQAWSVHVCQCPRDFPARVVKL